LQASSWIAKRKQKSNHSLLCKLFFCCNCVGLSFCPCCVASLQTSKLPPAYTTKLWTNTSLWLGVESVCSRRDGRNTGRTGAGDEERVSTPSADQWEPVQLLQLACSTSPACRSLFLAGLLTRFTVTCCTVVLQCYRRQAVPMEQDKVRSSVTLYSFDRSLPNLMWLIMWETPTQVPILVEFGWVGNFPPICDFL